MRLHPKPERSFMHCHSSAFLSPCQGSLEEVQCSAWRGADAGKITALSLTRTLKRCFVKEGSVDPPRGKEQATLVR